MCELCTKIGASQYSTKFSQYMLEDAERLLHTESGIIFSQAEFPFIEPLVFFEPRVALPKPTRYYQPISVDGNPLRQDWSSGSTKGIAFKNGKVILLSKSVTKTTGQPEVLGHYFLAQLSKEELKVSEKEGTLAIAFDGKVDGINIRTHKPESHTLTFNFMHQHNEKAFVPESRLSSSAVYSGASRVQSTQAFARFENYSVTVMHFAPHPLLMQSHKELGFASALDFQKSVYDILKKHLVK